MPDISCQQMLAEYYSAKKKALAVLAIPFAMINAAESLIAAGVNSTSNLLNAALGVVTATTWDLGVQDMLSSLYRLMDCVYLASSAMGPTIAGAIDALELGQDIPEDMKNILRQQARGALGEAVDAVTDTPYGKLADLDEKYRNIVNSQDTRDAMNALRDLEQCLSALCTGYEQGDFSYTALKERVGAGVDGTVESIVDAANKAPADMKQAAKNFSLDYKSAKDLIESKTFSVLPH